MNVQVSAFQRYKGVRLALRGGRGVKSPEKHYLRNVTLERSRTCYYYVVCSAIMICMKCNVLKTVYVHTTMCCTCWSENRV